MKLRIIRGPAPMKLPLADRCVQCFGKRLLIQDGHLVPCNVCNGPEEPDGPVIASEPAPVDVIARAA